jgi:hypothetical protein
MAGKRQKAWRNMMVAAINSGIAMGYISLASTDEERASDPVQRAIAIR